MTLGDKSYPDAINELQDIIDKKNTFTHSDIDRLSKKVFALKKKYIENEKNYRVLKHIHEILHHERSKLNSLKMSVISTMGSIFLPLGFIVGYFGMNFQSMGSPSLNSGVFSVKHIDKFVIGISVGLALVIIIMYKIRFH